MNVREGLHKCHSHRRARQASPDKNKCPHSSLDEGCPLMEAMSDMVIPREDNPAASPHFREPLHITRVLRKMLIMRLALCPGLS